MVVVRRSNSFVLWLLFILFSTRCSLAYTYKAITRETAVEGTILTAARDVVIVKDNQKDLEALLTPKGAKFGKVGGRKMMNKKDFGKEYAINMNNQKENIVEADQVTKISGANHTVGSTSYGHKGKGKMNDMSKMRAKIGTISRPVKVKIGDLFAFSADYRKRLHQLETPLGTPKQHTHEQSKTSIVPKPKTRSSRKAYLNTVDEFQHWKLINEATNDNIMSLMNKDYPGGGNKPRHKPPINNNEPVDHPSATP